MTTSVLDRKTTLTLLFEELLYWEEDQYSNRTKKKRRLKKKFNIADIPYLSLQQQQNHQDVYKSTPDRNEAERFGLEFQN